MKTYLLTQGDNKTTADAAESPKRDTGEAQDISDIIGVLATAAGPANVVTASAHPMTSLTPSDSSHSPHLPVQDRLVLVPPP